MNIQSLIFTLVSIIILNSYCVYGQEADIFKNDSIKYELQLNNTTFKKNEPIILTIIVRNISRKNIRFWFDGGNYPIGNELELTDSKGNSMVKEYWVNLSSNIYSLKEIEYMKTLIPANYQYRKEYYLRKVIQLKKDLSPGIYELKYSNAKPIKFTIK